MDRYVMIPNNIVQNEGNLYSELHSPNLLYVMWAISNSQEINGEHVVSIDYMLNLCNLPITQRSVKAVKNTLNELEYNSLIEIESRATDFTKSDFIRVKTNWLQVDDKGEAINYFRLSNNDVYAIMNGFSNNKMSNHLALTVYCNIVSRILLFAGEEYECSFPSFQRISKELGMRINTIHEYTEKLHEMKILMKMNSGKWFKENSVKVGRNFYTLYKENWENILSNAVESDRKGMIANGWLNFNV